MSSNKSESVLSYRAKQAFMLAFELFVVSLVVGFLGISIGTGSTIGGIFIGVVSLFATSFVLVQRFDKMVELRLEAQE